MRYFVIFSLLCFVASCGRPQCKNTDPVFAGSAPDTKEYKQELVKQLKASDAAGLHYWIDNYLEKDGKMYMGIYIQGNGLCAKGILDITNKSRLDNFTQAKGKSYSGAELRGLTYSIDANDNLVFENVAEIKD